jgi:hypothetical protein
MSEQVHGYSIFGLTVRSQLPFGEFFQEADLENAADVEVRWGVVDVGETAPAGYSTSPAGTLLRVPRTGAFLIRQGREIIVSIDPEGSERNLRLFLLGSAFGALLHQRGLLPLHANAVEIDGRAVAFSGHSGAGKSTMAAWFHDRGHRILSDDVCVIATDADGKAVAYPGIPRLRLWREALEASGRSADEYQRSFDDMDKYDVPTLEQRRSEPLTLDRIYMLRKADDGPAVGRITRLSGVEAVDALVSNTYRGGYLSMIGRTGEHLMACVRIAKAVPVYAAERLWGFDSFTQEAERLAAHGRGATE